MSSVYQLKEGDDIREIRLTLTSTPAPVSAQLVISRGSIRQVRDLDYDSDLGKWKYRFTDADFVAMPGGKPNNYKAEVYATFADATNGTYPTVGTLLIQIYARL